MPSESEKIKHLWLAGADGLGTAMTGLRIAFGKDGYVTASLLPTSLRSLRDTFPLRAGERTIIDHFQNTARSLEEQLAPHNHIVIELHSGGLWEFVQLIPYINPNFWQDKKVEVVILGGAGLAENGIRSFLGRLQKVAEGMKFGEQHSVFPVDSERYYELMRQEYPNTYGDSRSKRYERRIRFLKILNELEPNEQKRTNLLYLIEEIDMRMNYVSRKEMDVYIKQRATILAPYITKMFHGEHIRQETHKQVIQNYGESLNTREKLRLLAPSLVASLSFFARSMKHVHRGMGSYLLDALKKIEESGALSVRTHALIAQFDSMLSPNDIDWSGPRPIIRKTGLPLESAVVVENFNHGSYGINEDSTRTILTTLFG